MKASPLVRARWVEARRELAAVVVCVGPLLALTRCHSSGTTSADGGCQLDDENGASGGAEPVVLTVSDTAFTVGGPDSGSTSTNVAFENSSTVRLTLFNVGTRPHDFTVECQPPSADNCERTWCFPDAANIPALAPGASATTTFVAPFSEGVYVFTSDLDGDTQVQPDGGVTGLSGEFVLM
jgi:hypothetical protein